MEICENNGLLVEIREKIYTPDGNLLKNNPLLVEIHNK